MIPSRMVWESRKLEVRPHLKERARKRRTRLMHWCAAICAVLALLAFGVARAASSGPASGGNTLTINGTGLGNGSDITNVTLCGVPAAIQAQTRNSVTVLAGAAGDGGTGDINVFSASAGVTTFTNGYTYKPPGAIFGSFMGWSSISNLPMAIYQPGATSVNGKIYAIGGGSNNYVYDPSHPTSGWLSISNLPSACSEAVTVNGKIYAIGVSSTGVYVYDPEHPTLGWLSLSNLPGTISYLSAAAAEGKIYATGVGGFGNGVCVYDPARPTQGWSLLNYFSPTWRPFAAMAATAANGKIYLMGGEGYGAGVCDLSQPAAGWTGVSGLPNSFGAMASTSVNGKVYSIGGFNFLIPAGVSSVYVYDPEQPALNWLTTSNLPKTIWFSGAASVSGNIYVIGGYNNGVTYSTVYKGSFASGVVPASGPLSGADTVTINGNNLGNGDVTNVTLCGIPATIVADYSPTQLVVSAGAAIVPGSGDVVVNSTSYGTTVGTGAYTYVGPPTVTAVLNGTNLQLSWPTNCLGWGLEAQTNPLGGGLGANWFPVGGSTATNQLLIFVDPANGSAFFRLHQQ